MEKINVAQLLKDCPKGMELDCVLFNNPVTLDEVANNIDEHICPIIVNTEDGDIETFTKYGQYLNRKDAKCIIFPKGKTTWEGFHRPFKDGDIIYTRDEYSDVTFTYVAILKQIEKGGEINSHCFYNYEDDVFNTNNFLYDSYNIRFATEEEKQKLFNAIKANGYKWNDETKILEKLFQPKFELGDSIRIKGTSAIYVVTEIREDCYMLDDKDIYLTFKTQDEWELVTDKFDINTLKPFESRVLVRDNDYDEWKGAFWSHLRQKADIKYDTIRGVYRQCIPYNDDTKHLLGKTNSCDDYYKIWK